MAKPPDDSTVACRLAYRDVTSYLYEKGKRKMKRLIISISMLGLLLTALSFSAFAQEEEDSAKNLYLAHARDLKKGRPGVKVTVELKRDGVSRKVPLDYAFRSGD